MIVVVNTKKGTIREIRNRKEKKQDMIERWANRMNLISDVLSAMALNPFWRNTQQKIDFINTIADEAKMNVTGGKNASVSD